MPWVSPSYRTCTYTASHWDVITRRACVIHSGDVHFPVWGISTRLTTSALHIRLCFSRARGMDQDLFFPVLHTKRPSRLQFRAVLRKHKEPPSKQGSNGTPSAKLMSWICDPPRQPGQGTEKTSRFKGENATRRGPRNGGRLLTDPIINRLGSHAGQHSPRR